MITAQTVGYFRNVYGSTTTDRLDGGSPPPRHALGGGQRGNYYCHPAGLVKPPQERPGMTCVHCGETTLTRSYTLRFTPETHHPRVIDLQLCTVCLRRLRAESDIELLADPVVTAD